MSTKALDPPDEEPPSPSRLRLILAAEELFAERGIEGVSLREIALAAGQGNNAAVQYHFRTRDGLVAAIFAYRVSQMDVTRRAMLEKISEAGAESDLRALLRVLFLPHLGLADRNGGHPYARFLSQYVIRYRPTGVPHISDLRTPASRGLRQLAELIAARVGFLAAEQASKRLELVNLFFLNMLVRYDAAKLSGRPTEPLADQIDDVVEMAAAALAAPPPRRGELFPITDLLDAGPEDDGDGCDG